MIVKEFAYPKVMQFFEEISGIPRGSYHEEQIALYLEGFAKERGLDCYRDALGNVLINCEASEGYEQEPALLMQGHTDMVCEKNEGVEHDFLTDGIDLFVEDGWLRAKGTTLGADNGVAVAVMLATLDGALGAHPALQCLFTVSEEVGLDGMKGFDMSRLFARQMLNMDSADENSIVVGCAGGMRTDMTIPVTRKKITVPLWKLRLGGLYGGHSGEDIHRGRANANRLLAFLLSRWRELDPTLRLISLHGGSKDNAIPREATAIVMAEQGMVEQIRGFSSAIRKKLCDDDSGFFVELVPVTTAHMDPMDEESTEKILSLICEVRNGVLSMCPHLPDLVEFSRNLAVVKTEEEALTICFSSRSAIDEQIDESAEELDALARTVGGVTRHHSRYPGWSFEEHSPLREKYVAAYEKLFAKQPKLETIHAGLECGLVKEIIPDMDILSCGPVILDLHSPDESLDLASFERFISIVKELLHTHS